jgi:prepilin-type N-terminal cleavage/methylation domain-containing protein
MLVWQQDCYASRCGSDRQFVNAICHDYITRLSFCSRRDSRRQHTKMKTDKTSRKAGFTLVEIMIVVAIIGLLAAIAIPNFIRARATSQANACINNLRQIDAAINEWALENGKKTTDAVTSPQIVSAYIKLNVNSSVPGCPAGGSYTTSSVGASRQISCSLSTLTPGHFLP